MTAYYNEFDPKAAAWLRELIKQNLIAPGEVDGRSIEDVKPNDLKGYAQCHFFAGIGVWSYALRQSGWSDNTPVWTGSCPCQPFSAAGKGTGFADDRHLWPAFHHLIKECSPDVVFGEQVASKDGLAWLDLLCADLEAEGYSVGAVDTCAAGVGAPHVRQRLYWAADANSFRPQGCQLRLQEDKEWGVIAPSLLSARNEWDSLHNELPQSVVCPKNDGTSSIVGRLRGYGNALVAQQAQVFIEAYREVIAFS